MWTIHLAPAPGVVWLHQCNKLVAYNLIELLLGEGAWIRRGLDFYPMPLDPSSYAMNETRKGAAKQEKGENKNVKRW